MTFLCLNCFYVYVTWKFPFHFFFLHVGVCFLGEASQSLRCEAGKKRLRVGKNYVSLGIILMTDIHKYLFMYKQELFSERDHEGAKHFAEETRKVYPFMFVPRARDFVEASFGREGAKRDNDFSYFHRQHCHSHSKETLPKITVRKWSSRRRKVFRWVKIMYTHSCIPNVYFICEG